jgi:hypothetical protein
MEGLTIWELAAAENNEKAKSRASNLQEILMAAKAYIIRQQVRSSKLFEMHQSIGHQPRQNAIVTGQFRTAGQTPRFHIFAIWRLA